MRYLIGIAVGGNETRGQHDIRRHGRCRQHEGDQRIRIECDRGEQLLQAFLRECLGGGQRLILLINLDGGWRASWEKSEEISAASEILTTPGRTRGRENFFDTCEMFMKRTLACTGPASMG